VPQGKVDNAAEHGTPSGLRPTRLPIDGMQECVALDKVHLSGSRTGC
jgi:hypothetical protein